jgi:hypothetical protein
MVYLPLGGKIERALLPPDYKVGRDFETRRLIRCQS